MPHSQKINQNGKVAGYLFSGTIASAKKIVTYTGKPAFFLLIVLLNLLIVLTRTVTNFARLSIKTYYQTLILLKKIKNQKLWTKNGEIFIFKKHDLETRVSAAGAKLQEKYETLKKKYQFASVVWKFQVFLLAVEKFAGKGLTFFNIGKRKTKLFKQLRFFFLKFRLQRITKKRKTLLLFSNKKSKQRSEKLTHNLLFSKRLKLLSYSLILISSFVFLVAGLFWQYILKDLPSVTNIREVNLPVSTRIYDRSGVLLYTIYKDVNRTPVKLTDLSNSIKLATLAAEDAEFYSHPGFSLKGIARAIYKDIRERRITGGSTITQQLVKNTLLSPEKTFVRKIKEIILSTQVEQTFSKDEILEMYLNQVSYGGTAYGIQEAARTYFGKDAKSLTLGEAAFLAGLPKSPTLFSPYGDSPKSAINRQKDVLRLMEDHGFISYQQKQSAIDQELIFEKQKMDIKAPHFVFFVRNLLEQKYGKNTLESGGLKVVTSLDYGIQKLAEDVLRSEIDKLANLHVTNGAVVVLAPKTGEILAMVGSKDFFDESIDGNVNVATMERQPGSSIKLINYAYALSHNFTLSTIIPDTPVTFKVDGQEPYTPKNYEGGFRGNIPLRNALAESRNIPAVRILASYGVNNMINEGKKLGITSWTNPENYGLSLTLGGGAVKLIDLANVYATVADYGNHHDLMAVRSITNYKGESYEKTACISYDDLDYETNPSPDSKFIVGVDTVVAATEQGKIAQKKQDPACNGTSVLDPRVAFMLTDILHDNSARSASFGVNSLLNIDNHKEVAVKTGTSNDLRDNLAIGYNQKYLVAVWVGNNDNSQMERIASGVTGATPIFNKIMTALLNNEQSRSWLVPSGLVHLPICPLTNSLPCDQCPTRMEWFIEENKPQTACTQEDLDKVNQSASNETANNTENPPMSFDLNNQSFEKYIQNQFQRIRGKNKNR